MVVLHSLPCLNEATYGPTKASALWNLEVLQAAH